MANPNPRRTPSAATPGDNGQPPKHAKGLRKGATFHSPPSVHEHLCGVPSPPGMTRSWSGLEEVVGANCRRAALALDDFQKVMSQADEKYASFKAQRQASIRDNGRPLPPGLFGQALAKPDTVQHSSPRHSPRRIGRHGSDSGLGSSLDSSKDKCTAVASTTRVVAPTLTGSSKAKQTLPGLTRRALSRIHEHILLPLLGEAKLKEFHQIIEEVPHRISSKEIICLRDVEKTLILTAPGSAKTVSSYLHFCYLAVDCVQATVEFLSDCEQVRPHDRPYTNGYFIDLKDQILEYGDQLRAARSDKAIADSMDLDPSDKIELVGGVATNGRPAQLVRVKPDGTAISLATGKPVVMDKAPTQFKRSASEQREDEEEIMRSMARRKKNASPEELAPKRCREPGCNKQFKRPCDLTKHEKTHSRPWKCPVATCKYHEFGWPTEKEMDRHVNDKHLDSPAMFECLFKPCPYKSKRESNCKQHMEKAHGWHYSRSKTNGKRPLSTPTSQLQHTPPLGSESSPSTTHAFSAPTPPEEHATLPRNVSIVPAGMECLGAHDYHMGTSSSVGLGLEGLSSSDVNGLYPAYQDGPGFISDEDIYAASAQMPPQQAAANQVFDKMMTGGLSMYPGFELCQPQLSVTSHPQVQPHFAAPVTGPPLKSADAMFYSPPDSISDEGFDEPHMSLDNGDFPLFPAHVDLGSHLRLPLFDEPPSSNLGFSQTTQPDIFQQMEWSNFDYMNLQQQG